MITKCAILALPKSENESHQKHLKVFSSNISAFGGGWGQVTNGLMRLKFSYCEYELGNLSEITKNNREIPPSNYLTVRKYVNKVVNIRLDNP